MVGHDIVVVSASAEALRRLLEALDDSVRATFSSCDGRIWLLRGQRASPILPLFRSAAIAYGAHVIGVALSSDGADAAAGLAAVKSRAGITVLQWDDDSREPTWRDAVVIDHVVTPEAMAPLLARLVAEPVAAAAAVAAAAPLLVDVEVLWTALRALEDNVALAERVAARAERLGFRAAAEKFVQQARDIEERAQRIREVLFGGRARGESAATGSTREAKSGRN